MPATPNHIHIGDNLSILKEMPGKSVDLIYIDPPFNTGKQQSRTRIKTEKSADGDRKGFKGNSYKTTVVGTKSYDDKFDEYIDGFLRPRLEEAYRVLKLAGSLYFHIDYREVHYCKILLDEIFRVREGVGGFLNEIIWAYDYGGRSKKRWPAKHDTIMLYVKDKHKYTFNQEAVNQIEFKAPSAGALKPIPSSDTWWHTIVPTNGAERTGYPTQKPLGIMERVIIASSNPGDVVLDFFAGSGTTGASCQKLGRRFILIDNNPEAQRVMRDRFGDNDSIEWKGDTDAP